MIKGFVWFLLVYVVPIIVLSAGTIPADLFPEYTRLTSMFAAMIVFFVVASELLSKTVFQHTFNVARAIVLMIFFLYALNGGFVTIDLENLHMVIDLRVYLAMVLTINFLGVAKGVLQTLNFLSERTETDQPLRRE